MRPILSLLATLALCLPGFAQQGANDEILTLTTQLYGAVDGEKWDEAIGILKRLDVLQPETLGNAYNLACMYSRKSDADNAAAWLDKAISWGWGGGKGGIYAGRTTQVERLPQPEMSAKDADLEFLRKDPRYAKLEERMQALQKRAVEYAATPAIYVPEKLKDLPELPVLLVLHAAGGEKNAALAAWKPLADELGCALVVPAAPYPLREDPARGWSWIDDPNNFALANRTAEYHQPVLAGLEALRKTRKLDAQRVWIAGEAQGATLALVASLHNPGLLRGAALLDPEVIPALSGYKVPGARAAGLRIEARFDTSAEKTRAGAEVGKGLVAGWSLAGTVRELTEVKDASVRHVALFDAVRALSKAGPGGAVAPAPAK